MKIKKKVIKKVMSFFLAFLLLVSSFTPYLLITPAFSQVKAQEVVEVISLAPTAEPTLTPIETTTPTPTVDPIATPTPDITPMPSTEMTPTATPEAVPSQWTFEKVELNKEYIAPQNSELKLTFTKLPDPAGNIKIEEITLTEDQIKQTGSLSDKAYDITSDMENGTFEYTLTLPTPTTNNVEVKASEDGQNFVTVGGVTAQIDTLTITNLNHFTIFVVTATGGGSISSDTTGGSYTTLTGPVLPEGAAGDIDTGTIILSLPSGFTFNTANNVTATVGEVTAGSCSDTSSSNTPTQLGTGSGLSSQTVVPTTTSVTINVKTKSKGNTCKITFSGIQVRPSSGTPLASGNITISLSSTATLNGIILSTTNLGSLAEAAGAVSTSHSTVSSNPTSVAADGSTTSTVTVTLKDTFDNLVSGKTVTLSSSRGGTDTISAASGSSSASGVVTFTVKSSAIGISSYTATDTTDANLAISQTASVNFTNVAPVANNQTVSTNEDTAKTINLSATDVEGAPLTYILVSDPSNGSLSGSGSSRTYTPNADFNGSDSFTFRATDGINNSNTATVNITVNAINDTPSFTKGSDQNVSEDVGSQTVSSWATSISKGPSDESGQTLAFSVTNNNNALFSAQPEISVIQTDMQNSLRYTPAANAYGSATVTVVLNDQGGASSATQTFTITVNPVNDTPSFTKGSDQNVSEDAGAQTVSGWATSISIGPSNESGQTFSFNVSNNNNSLFSVQPAVAANGTLTYTPAANANGSATVSVSLQDNGGTTNGGNDTSATQTFMINVNAVNDAPTVTVTSPNGGEIWAGGSSHNITWNASDVDVSNTLTVNLSYTTNGTDFISIASGLTNSGTYTWNPVASLNSSTVTVRAIATDPSNATGIDLSNTNFTIDSTVPTGTIAINGGAAYTNAIDHEVTLTLSAGSDLSGVTEMAFSNGSDYSDWEAYSISKSLWTLSPNDGSKTVRVKFRDAAGNETSPGIPAYITVDTTKPVIASHDNITTEATSGAGATVTYISPATSDTVDGTSTAVCLPTSGTVFAIGTTAVNCTKTDAAGNTATPTTFNVTAQDTTIPVITRSGSESITLEIKTPYTDAGATATDLVGGNLTSSIATVNPVNVNTAGTYTITYNVKDAANNSATQVTRTVNVVDSVDAVFNGISNDLATAGIASNMSDVTTNNIQSFSGLYFEKSVTVGEITTKMGKITFTSALDLSKDETKTFLENLGTKMDMAGAGIISLDFRGTTSDLSLKDVSATIEFYGLDALGFTADSTSDEVNSKLIAYDDDGNILDKTALVDDPGTYTPPVGVCEVGGACYIFSVNVNHFTKYKIDEATQTTPNIDGDATLSGDTTEVVLTDPDQNVTVNITDGTVDPTIDVSAFVSDNGEGGVEGILPEITINSGVADVVIPDGTTVTGPAGWDGIIQAPISGTPSGGNAPAGFSVGSTVISVGSPDGTLTFDTAVTIVLPGVTGTVGYRPSGSDTWYTITNVCTGTYANPTGAVYPGECAINNGTDTKIVTYHFTSFGSLIANQSTSGSVGTSTAGAPVCNDTKPGSAPTLLSAIAGFNSVTLTWSKAVDPVSYYLMTFGRSAGSQTYGNPNVGGKDTTSYTVNGLSGGATYYFRVRAGNGCAPGDFSNELSAAPTGGFIEGVPVGFEAGVLGETTNSEESEELTGESTPTGTALGVETKNGVINSWWWPWILLSLLPLGWVVYHYKKTRS